MRRTPRVVLDTNLFVAAFFNRDSASSRILSSAIAGDLECLWSKATKKETERILQAIFSSFKRSRGSAAKLKQWQKEVLGRVFEGGREVEKPPAVKRIEEDPSDDKFLAVALAGKADYIVSNDEHLLQLGNFETIPILTPSEFIERT